MSLRRDVRPAPLVRGYERLRQAIHNGELGPTSGCRGHPGRPAPGHPGSVTHRTDPAHPEAWSFAPPTAAHTYGCSPMPRRSRSSRYAPPLEALTARQAALHAPMRNCRDPAATRSDGSESQRHDDLLGTRRATPSCTRPSPRGRHETAARLIAACARNSSGSSSRTILVPSATPVTRRAHRDRACHRRSRSGRRGKRDAPASPRRRIGLDEAGAAIPRRFCAVEATPAA